MIQTLLKGLRGTDWEMLTDFVSPVFFDVVPTLGMASVFASIAKDYANKNLNARVVLIDGVQFGLLMVRHGIGVQKQKTYSIVDIDEDYFED